MESVETSATASLDAKIADLEAIVADLGQVVVAVYVAVIQYKNGKRVSAK